MSAKYQVDDLRSASGKASTRLSGHELPFEGKATLPDGKCRCLCGRTSPSLPSNRQRKAWHRQHKLNVILGQTR